MLRWTRMARTLVPLFLAVTMLTPPGLALVAQEPLERPIGSVVITGELHDRVLLTFQQLEALPLTPRSLQVTFQAGSSVETHTFTGFLLYDVLNFLKPQFDAT